MIRIVDRGLEILVSSANMRCFLGGLSMLHDTITEVIIGAAYEVMNDLGTGFLESVYHRSLFHLLTQTGQSVDYERQVPVVYRGYHVGQFRADLVVNNTVIIEVKAVSELVKAHKAQVINYLKASGLPVGLLINFGRSKVDIARLENPS